MKTKYFRQEIAISILYFIACSSIFAGQIIAWGEDNWGQTNIPAFSTNVIALASGGDQGLALLADGTVSAWGLNDAGQTNVPAGLSNVVAVSGGNYHSLALRKDGTLALWGSIALETTTVPPNATNVVRLGTGVDQQHALVSRADGSVMDWGITGNYGMELTNVPPRAINIVDVAAGLYHAMALRSDGSVVVWGDDSYGQTNVPSNATNIVEIAASENGCIALRSDGTILTWGAGSVSVNLQNPPWSFTNIVDVASPLDDINGAFGGNFDLFGVRGNGSLAEYPGVSQYPGSNITAIAAGSDDGFALVASGPPIFPGLPVNRGVASGLSAYLRLRPVGAWPMSFQWTCNGTNLPGATNCLLTLTNVQPNLAGSQYYLIASNAFGMASNGPITLNETPSELYVAATATAAVVDETVTITASSIGQGSFSYQWQFDGTNLANATNLTLFLNSLQLSNGGTYAIIASNAFGLVTNSVTLTVVPTIVTSPPQNQVAFVGGGASFGIGVQAIIPVSYQWQFNGTNLAGGTNTSFSLTNLQYARQGTYSVVYTDSFETVTNGAILSIGTVAAWGDMGQQSVAPGLTNIISVTAGFSHGLALQADGTVVGWGQGQGVGGTEAAPPGLSNVIAISAGNQSSLALKSDGTVVAWGENTYGETNVPIDLTNVVAIAAGSFHGLALRADGTVAAWGDNSSGETNVPIGLTNVVAIDANQYTSMVLKADGTVVAWGDNTYGESSVPNGLSNVVQIAGGGDHSLALQANGAIVGWGENEYGQLNAPTNLPSVARIRAGFGHSGALTDSGLVEDWGYNYFGETNVPGGLSNVVVYSAQAFHNLALIGNSPPTIRTPLSNLQLTSNGFSLSVSSESGRVYVLQYKNSLSDSNWNTLPLVAGTGRTMTLADPGATNSQRFYRVQKW